MQPFFEKMHLKGRTESPMSNATKTQQTPSLLHIYMKLKSHKKLNAKKGAKHWLLKAPRSHPHLIDRSTAQRPLDRLLKTNMRETNNKPGGEQRQ